MLYLLLFIYAMLSFFRLSEVIAAKGREICFELRNSANPQLGTYLTYFRIFASGRCYTNFRSHANCYTDCLDRMLTEQSSQLWIHATTTDGLHFCQSI
jgi:hypothetical protein